MYNIGMDVDSDELARFREEWRAEVRHRSNQTYASPPPSTGKAVDEASANVSKPSKVSAQVQVKPVAHAPRLTDSGQLSKGLSLAVESYRLAIQYEQSGELDEALRLYRNAFRLDSNVDKAYRRMEVRLETETETAHAAILNGKQDHKVSALEEDRIALAKVSQSLKEVTSKHSDTNTLAKLISSFPHNLDFEPMDESEGVPLRILPDEVLVLVLKTLDPLSIERFASLSRKARVLSLDSSIWRFLVLKTYIPPQIPNDLTTEAIAEHYMLDYRRFFIERPRLRLDGVYIAVCHYVRPGINRDNAWVNVSHLITYHRYLRFFPDGTVLSLLANEDVDPPKIVPLLESSLRMKGLMIGKWTLEENKLFVRDLADPTGGNKRYTFRMTLTLLSRPLGRWNKLDLAEYDSVNVENGKAVPVALKHERPFWFSKVRSYSTY